MNGLLSDIRGEKYKKFIRWACGKSDAVMLVFYYGTIERKDIGERTRKRLEAYRIASRDDPAIWTFTDRSKNPYEVHIDMYKICPEIEDYLLHVEGLYDWGYPDSPEDLAFFDNGVCWFASTTHEHEASFYGDEKENRLMLKELGIPYETYTALEECYTERY